MHDKGRQMSRIALGSVVVGVVLTGIKLVVGLLTGSLGILSEAAHSLLDLGAALITLFAVRAAARPADHDHPYGHGKVENLSALTEALLLLGTCVWIVYEAVERLSGRTVEVDASVWSFVVMGVSLVLDVVISRVLYAGARKYGSQALEADALHYSSDILSSAVVIAGLIGVRCGYPILDPLAAVGVAVLVTVASIRLGKRTIDALLDRAPEGLPEQIRDHLRAMGLVQNVERVRVRRSGPSAFVDLIATVPRGLSLERSHEIADCLEAEVRQLVPECDVLVHFHPSTAGETVIDAVRTISRRFASIDDVHNIQCYEDGATARFVVTLHIKLSPELSLEQAHRLVDDFEETVRKELPQVGELTTHIETRAPLGGGRRQPVPPAMRLELTEAVLKDDRVRGLHDVTLHTSSAGLILTCHLETRPELPLAEAHQATTEAEKTIRRLLPDVNEVVIHAEPGPPAAP